MDELYRPVDPAFIADPYPSLNRLRELYPVVQDRSGTWLLSRYADISSVNRNPQARRIGPNGVTAAIPWFNLERYPNATAQVRDSLFLRDGDDHARLRTLVSEAFTPRSLERLYALVRPVLARMLDRQYHQPVPHARAVAGARPAYRQDGGWARGAGRVAPRSPRPGPHHPACKGRGAGRSAHIARAGRADRPDHRWRDKHGHGQTSRSKCFDAGFKLANPEFRSMAGSCLLHRARGFG